MLTRVDVNSDMGEIDASDVSTMEVEMMPLLTSVSIACGGHAGTPALMRRTAQLAARYGVAIGAHPGLPDAEHFGRTERPVSPTAVTALVMEQVRRLGQVLAQDGLAIVHVKPHGALYNMAGKHADVARAIVQAVRAVDCSFLLFALAGSELAKAGEAAGLTVVQEAFADRTYRADGSLVPRAESGAVLQDEEAVRRQVRQLVMGTVTSVEGARVSIQADSICLHSDTPRAAPLARLIRRELESAGVRIMPAQRPSERRP